MSEQQVQQGDQFDRIAGAIIGVPDVKQTAASSVVEALPIVGNVTTYTVQTFRLPERGFMAFLTIASSEGAFRHVLPDKVLAAIYRQRERLTDRSTPASRARAKAKRDRARKRAAKEARRNAAKR